MPNSLIFCIPVKNCIINSTATLDRPQGLEPQNHFDPAIVAAMLSSKKQKPQLLCLFLLNLQSLDSQIALSSSVTLSLFLNPHYPWTPVAKRQAVTPPPHLHRVTRTGESMLSKASSNETQTLWFVASFSQLCKWWHSCHRLCTCVFPSSWNGNLVALRSPA